STSLPLLRRGDLGPAPGKNTHFFKVDLATIGQPLTDDSQIGLRMDTGLDLAIKSALPQIISQRHGLIVLGLVERKVDLVLDDTIRTPVFKALDGLFSALRVLGH